MKWYLILVCAAVLTLAGFAGLDKAAKDPNVAILLKDSGIKISGQDVNTVNELASLACDFGYGCADANNK